MESADIKHIVAGTVLAILSFTSLYCGWNIVVSIILAIALSLYIILLFIQCAFRAKDNDGTTNTSIFPLPSRTWALLLVILFVFSNVMLFSNMYLKSEGIIDQSQDTKVIMENKIDAVYFSLVTLTTLGYGDFIPNKDGRCYVIFHLTTGFLLLLVIIPVVASRVTTW